MRQLTEHPVRQLDGRRLGPHALRLARLEPGEKSGWARFHLLLVAKDGDFTPPLVDALYSAGGRGVMPWIEVLAYQPEVRRCQETLDLRGDEKELALFAALAELIPPGGHIMVGCETPPHHDTYQALLKGVPPAATPLGMVLFHAGFRRVKFFYLAEGGWEGQQKLWAEKPLHQAMQQEWDAATMGELKRFLQAPAAAPAAAQCVAHAAALVRELETTAPESAK